MKKYSKLIALFTFLFLLLPIKVKATDAVITISGANQVEKGKTITLNVMVTSISGSPLTNFQGTLSIADSSCLSIKGVTAQNSAGYGNNTIVYSQQNGVSANTSFAQVVLTASNNTCSTNVTITDGRLQFEDRTKYTGRSASKTINVVEPAQQNNNNTGGNNNPGGNTNNDKPSGETGNSGNNTGGNTNSGGSSSKPQDNRSSDNALKSLKVNNATLSPAFNANTLNYTINVDLDVTKLDISAEARDSKAKVTINNPELAENAKTTVTIKVTAENGVVKTYTISVIRGTLPEKPLNDDNTLTKLVPSVGMLSPKFEPSKLKYYIYLPYEIETIDFEYLLSDTNGTVEIEGDKELKPNAKNVINIKVTAEDGSEKIYTVNVFRAMNPEYLENDNVKIKSLKIGSANLIGEFSSDKAHYYYTGELNLSDIIPVDSNATYEVIKEDDVTYIVVEAPNGDVGIYCFHKEDREDPKTKKKKNLAIIILSATTGLGIAGSTYLLIDKYYLAKKRIKKNIK